MTIAETNRPRKAREVGTERMVTVLLTIAPGRSATFGIRTPKPSRRAERIVRLPFTCCLHAGAQFIIPECRTIQGR